MTDYNREHAELGEHGEDPNDNGIPPEGDEPEGQEIGDAVPAPEQPAEPSSGDDAPAAPGG